MATLLFLAGCTESGKDTPLPKKESERVVDYEALKRKYDGVEIPMVRYVYDKNAGDPALSPEQGGPGFTGDGWKTNLDFLALGSADAVKGGQMTRALVDWPATLRMGGQNWNTTTNYMVRDLCYPALVSSHWHTLDFMPRLATHWKISDDRMTYYFRLNPSARWSDGSEVTTADYVASYKLWMDPTTLFPSAQLVYVKFEPVAESKYILRIDCKKDNWRNFLYAAGLVILPAKEIGGLTGTEYLEQYQFSYTSFCGPYRVDPSDIVKGKSITIRRNPDWWDANNPAWTGVYNIDAYKFIVVSDPILTFEKSKKCELDYYVIPKAQWYVEELPTLDIVKRGVLVRRKVYTDAPIGTSGLAMNSQRSLFKSVKVRKAIAHLFDRKKMIEKLMFNEYEILNSYWQGATYGNPNNEAIEFDQQKADQLLNEAGWTEINDQGVRVKDGVPFEFELSYRSKTTERYATIFQEDCKKLGIKVNLKLLTSSAWWKNLQQREYDVAWAAWGAIVFPNPETSWHSKLADKKENNNVTGFADPRIDALCDAYDAEYDVKQRREIIRKMDGIIYEQHPYALGWYNPWQRVVTTNRFRQPPWGGGRIQDRDEMHYAWWIDPKLDAQYQAAMADESKSMPIPDEKIEFWRSWDHQRAKAAAKDDESSPVKKAEDKSNARPQSTDHGDSK